MSLTFGHSGGLGDIVYSLPVIESICNSKNERAILYIKRYNHYNNTCDNYESIKPLLGKIDYIEQVLPYSGDYPVCQWGEDIKLDFNLDNFRNSLNVFENHLIKCHFAGLHVAIPEDWNRPWLKHVFKPSTIAYNLIHRTSRYHNIKTNWKRVIGDSNENFIYVGLPTEYENFIALGIDRNKVVFKETTNLLDVMELVQGAEKVYCNQSVVLTLAQSIGKPIYLELAPNHEKTVMLGNEILL